MCILGTKCMQNFKSEGADVKEYGIKVIGGTHLLSSHTHPLKLEQVEVLSMWAHMWW